MRSAVADSWLDRLLGEQSEKVKAAIAKIKDAHSSWEYLNGKTIYGELVGVLAGGTKSSGRTIADAGEAIDVSEDDLAFGHTEKYASGYLHALGIRGIKYLVQDYRAGRHGTHNNVIF